MLCAVKRKSTANATKAIKISMGESSDFFLRSIKPQSKRIKNDITIAGRGEKKGI